MQKLPPDLSETEATQGIKLGSVRYVLGISLALCVIAGAIFWMFHFK